MSKNLLMKPSFMILHCSNCHSHSMSTHHDEEKYYRVAYAIKSKIKEAIPDIAVDVNEFDKSLLI
jgi:hypothetical protein